MFFFKNVDNIYRAVGSQSLLSFFMILTLIYKSNIGAITVTTVFHEGEIIIQTESGVEERVRKFGNKLVRDHLIDQHKVFFENLPYVFVALHDEYGQLWVSIIEIRPGFIQSPDNKALNLNGVVIGFSQLGLQTKIGSPISIVGLDLNTRRRNRLNGTLKATAERDHHLSITIENSPGQLWFLDYPSNNFFQTFGNIHKHSNVSLMFLDFESGDLILVCGMARLETLTNASKVTAPTKKQPFLPRRIHFTLERGFRFKNTVAGRWSASELSPF